MKNKVIVILVALAMFGQVTLTVNADTIDTSTGTGESLAILNQEQTSFNVTVPTSLPITVDSAGVVTTSTDVKIHNNSYGPVVISDIQVDVANGWSLVDFDKDMSASTVGLKEFGFIIQGDKVQPDGSVALTPSSWGSVSGGAIKCLNYDAIVSPQKTALSGVNIANVVFILGWDEEVEPEETLKYTLATDDDFSKISGFAGEYFEYKGTDEYVEIPHVIKGENVTSYHQMFQRSSVKGVKSTNKNVTNMSGMFTSCGNLTTLDLSSFDTSNVTDMNCMFGGCTSLTTLDLSSFDTSNVTNMYRMFASCENLTTLDLSSFDTTNVTNMNGMFNFCESLTTLDLSSFDPSNVTDMNGMFDCCTGLTTLDLSNFDTTNVTDMKYMFIFCESLTTLDLSKFNTSNVTNMSGMFTSCGNLTTLDLSSFDTSNVTDMREVFDGCTGLTTLDLSSFDTSNVTDMNGMFSKCTSLQPVYARTQADADKFNASSNKPAGLTFILK